MHLGNPLTNGQAEACPLRIVSTSVVGAIKAVKDTALCFGRDSDAMISDGKPRDALLLLKRHLDPAPRPGVLHGVLDKV